MKRRRALAALVATVGMLAGSVAFLPATAGASWGGGPHYKHLDCRQGNAFCTEVGDQKAVFGNTYVGHDEPSLLFYSHKAGSGTRQQYVFKLPTDPPAADANTASYQFELNPTFWFGMAMCNSQSAPNPGVKCIPDSNKNITSDFSKQPGSAYLEMQFYPPGWVSWPAGDSCDATKWCAAVNVWSLAEDELHATDQNGLCASAIGGIEYGNFAFLTLNGKPQASPNPIDSTNATFTPDPKKDLFMSSGDTIKLRMFDSSSGLKIIANDLTSNTKGSMTLSAKNGFAEVKYAPPPSGACTPLPTNFHPEYSTSGPKTVVPWAAHTYNIAFAEEIGHFDWCRVGPNGSPVGPFGSCPTDNGEGAPWGPWRWSDGDDNYCFPGSVSTLVNVDGCLGGNANGFDGAAYLPDWPNGSPSYPTPTLFTSPTTGSGFTTQYGKVAFQADTAAIEEAPDCFHRTGLNCTPLPLQDDGQPVQFYPFYWTTKQSGQCWWGVGNDVPGMTNNDFGRAIGQFKHLESYTQLDFFNPGQTRLYYENFGSTLPSNPCAQSPNSGKG